MDCHCFGSLTQESVGWSTVARLLGLAVIAFGSGLLTIARSAGFTVWGLRGPSEALPLLIIASTMSIALIVVSQLVASMKQAKASGVAETVRTNLARRRAV